MIENNENKNRELEKCICSERNYPVSENSKREL